MTSGLVINARAIATRCCWPPESVSGSRGNWADYPNPIRQLAHKQLIDVATVETKGQHDVLSHRQRRDEIERLEDKSHMLASKHRELLPPRGGEVDPADVDLAGAWPVEPGRTLEQGRLARPGQPHDSGESAMGKAGSNALQASTLWRRP